MVQVQENGPGPAGKSGVSGGNRPQFGVRNTHKGRKAIIGLAILLVLSAIFYLFRERTQSPRPAPAASLAVTVSLS
jgi:hypothetical protein